MSEHVLASRELASSDDDVFAEVARCVRDAWSRERFRVPAFADVATHALQTVSPARVPKAELILAALTRLERGGHRACYHNAFNVIPVYADDQFILTFHAWTHTFGNPHSHEWSGAFQNLTDPVVYAEYEFEVRDAFDNDLQFGERTQRELRLLMPGDVVRVAQEVAIHGFGHTGLPGLTLAARARSAGGKTYDYWGTGLRVTTGAEDEIAQDTRLRARVVRALRMVQQEAFAERLLQTFARSSLRASVLLALDLAASEPRDAAMLADMVCEVHRPGDAYEASIRSAIEDRAFHAHVLAVFESCNEPRHRFLASLLCFAEDRAGFDWILERAGASEFGVAPGSWAGELAEMFTKAGYLPGTRTGDALRLVLRLMLDGTSKQRIMAEVDEHYSAPSLEDAVDMLMAAARELPLTRRIMPSTT